MIGRDFLSTFYREQVLPRLSIEDVFANVRFGSRRRREWRAPCPLHDGRGLNFSVNVDELVWRCHSSCQEGGDAIAYVMRTESLDFRGAVHELARRVGVDTAELGGDTAKSSAPSKLKPVRPIRPVAPEPTYPAPEEVEALWAACRPVTEAPHTAEAMRARRIDPELVAVMDLARALPSGGVELPRWARYRRCSWRRLGYHWLTPMFDACGRMRSVVARNVLPVEQRPSIDGEPMPKSLPPAGHRRSGLVIACPLARQLLEHGARPPWWPTGVSLRVEVCEGEKKFLQRVLAKSDANETAPAVIGIESGAWTAELAARIPDEAELYIATDPNTAGARYAAEIVLSLAPRIASGALRIVLREEFTLTFDSRGRPAVEVIG